MLHVILLLFVNIRAAKLPSITETASRKRLHLIFRRRWRTTLIFTLPIPVLLLANRDAIISPRPAQLSSLCDVLFSVMGPARGR